MKDIYTVSEALDHEGSFPPEAAFINRNDAERYIKINHPEYLLNKNKTAYVHNKSNSMKFYIEKVSLFKNWSDYKDDEQK